MRVFRDHHGFTLTELLVAMALMGIVMLATVALYVNSNALFMTETNRAEAQQGGRLALMIQEDLRMIGTSVPVAQARITAATAAAITFVGDTRGASTMLTVAVAAGDTTFTVSDTSGIKVNDSVNLISGITWQTSQNFTVTAVNATTITVSPAAAAAYPVGAQVGAPRTVTYQWDAGTETLWRNAGDGNGLLSLATGVQNFQLSYFDAADGATTVLANIRRIAITVTTRSTPAVSGYPSVHEGQFTINSDARPRNL